MPWMETRTVDERIRFIAAVHQDPKGNFTRLCQSFGISRAKGYKWVERYNELGPGGLEDRKPIAHTCPHRTPDEMTDRIVAMRKEHPFDGPKKIRARLLAQGVVGVPAASTVGDILDRYGLIRPRRARIRVPPHAEPLAHAQEANDVWCVDFKGHFVCGDGMQCHPLTISDAASRFLIKCEGLREPKTTPVREHFERAFREFGLPRAIRSDNGPPFASCALGGLSALSVWWIQLGILPERIEPGQPQQNGRHERMHKTLKEQTATPPSATMADQQRVFDRFRADYNEHRPHEALDMKPPASFYEPSLRVMPESPKPPEYDSTFAVRHVHRGILKWHGAVLKVPDSLQGQPVGLKETDEDEWELHYGPLLIAYILRRDNGMRIEPVG
jgi:transposase InsO family protein